MTVNQYFNHWNLLKSFERLLCLTFLTTSFFHHGKMHYQMVFSYTCQCLFLPTLRQLHYRQRFNKKQTFLSQFHIFVFLFVFYFTVFTFFSITLIRLHVISDLVTGWELTRSGSIVNNFTHCAMFISSIPSFISITKCFRVCLIK